MDIVPIDGVALPEHIGNLIELRHFAEESERQIHDITYLRSAQLMSSIIKRGLDVLSDSNTDPSDRLAKIATFALNVLGDASPNNRLSTPTIKIGLTGNSDVFVRYDSEMPYTPTKGYFWELNPRNIALGKIYTYERLASDENEPKLQTINAIKTGVTIDEDTTPIHRPLTEQESYETLQALLQGAASIEHNRDIHHPALVEKRNPYIGKILSVHRITDTEQHIDKLLPQWLRQS